MKIIITEKQAEKLLSKEIKCDKCDHKWITEKKDKNPFLCHDCGWDNEKKKYDNKELLNFWKNKLSKEPIDEKWSEKYKRSIDCNNPKGFSQRAHCQGRKKNG